jgi:mono/diheme cytochrome c family protein
MRTLRTLIFGVILGVLAVAFGLYFYFSTGMAPAATSAAPMPFEKMLAHKALAARIDAEMPKSAPIQPDDANLLAGAKIYRDNCAVCHGLPGQKPTAIASGMYPHPPKLMEGKGVTDDEPGESYWKVANGIRLTGMPGFSKSLSETEMWQVSMLVAHADKLPKASQDLLSMPMMP